MINCVIKDMFINSTKLCADMNIHMNNLTLCLKDTLVTTDKLCQYGMLIHCEIVDICRTLKIVPG